MFVLPEFQKSVNEIQDLLDGGISYAKIVSIDYAYHHMDNGYDGLELFERLNKKVYKYTDSYLKMRVNRILNGDSEFMNVLTELFDQEDLIYYGF